MDGNREGFLKSGSNDLLRSVRCAPDMGPDHPMIADAGANGKLS